jgi:hypothetical protein
MDSGQAARGAVWRCHEVPDGGGLTAAERARREKVRLEAAELMEAGYPVLVLVCKDSFPLLVAGELAAQLPADTTRLVRLPGARDHFPRPPKTSLPLPSRTLCTRSGTASPPPDTASRTG